MAFSVAERVDGFSFGYFFPVVDLPLLFLCRLRGYCNNHIFLMILKNKIGRKYYYFLDNLEFWVVTVVIRVERTCLIWDEWVILKKS